MTHFILGAAMLIAGFAVGVVVERNIRTGLECYQSVVYSGKSKCAIYVNKEVMR